MSDTIQKTGFVEVTNRGKVPLRLALNSRVWEIKPGQKAIVDREAACNLLGNWELRDHPTDALQKKRSEEYKRVRGLFGALPGGMYQEKHADGRISPLDPDDLWAKRRPYAEVVEDGNPVVLVIDDPEGKSLPAADTTGMDRDRLIQHLLTQQAQMADMISRLEAENRLPDDGPGDAVEDSPDVTGMRRRQRPAVTAVDERER